MSAVAGGLDPQAHPWAPFGETFAWWWWRAWLGSASDGVAIAAWSTARPMTRAIFNAGERLISFLMAVTLWLVSARFGAAVRHGAGAADRRGVSAHPLF